MKTPDKYIKHLECELASKHQSLKAYKEQWEDAMIENRKLRDDLKIYKNGYYLMTGGKQDE